MEVELEDLGATKGEVLHLARMLRPMVDRGKASTSHAPTPSSLPIVRLVGGIHVPHTHWVFVLADDLA